MMATVILVATVATRADINDLNTIHRISANGISVCAIHTDIRISIYVDGRSRAIPNIDRGCPATTDRDCDRTARRPRFPDIQRRNIGLAAHEVERVSRFDGSPVNVGESLPGARGAG